MKLLQPRCYLCDMPIDNLQPFLCLLCQQELPYLAISSCSSCAQPLTENQRLTVDQPLQCQQCITQARPWQQLIASMSYTLECQYLIKQFKFAKQPQLHLLFSQLLTRTIAAKIIAHNYKLPEAIVYIPLHKKRQAERGYNQAQLLASDMAKKLQMPLFTDKQFIRTKHTQAQAQQTALGRKVNMHNAFQVIPPFSVKHIALIDDVITTGETIREACLTLSAAGIEHIDIWCIARTLAD